MRVCAEPGCYQLVKADSRCAQHTRPTTYGWRYDCGRIRGRRLQALRFDLFIHEPFCRLCKALGRTSVAVIRDHIIPRFEGGTEEASNIQPLCRPCSDAKSRAEAARARTPGGP